MGQLFSLFEENNKNITKKNITNNNLKISCVKGKNELNEVLDQSKKIQNYYKNIYINPEGKSDDEIKKHIVYLLKNLLSNKKFQNKFPKFNEVMENDPSFLDNLKKNINYDIEEIKKIYKSVYDLFIINTVNIQIKKCEYSFR